jgi:hypothetical protein
MNFMTLFNNHNFLQIRQIAAVGCALGETAIVSECRFLTTFFTNSHFEDSFQTNYSHLSKGISL